MRYITLQKIIRKPSYTEKVLSQEFIPPGLNYRSWVKLVQFDSDHSLGNVSQEMCQAISSFCQLSSTI